jgi:hypothetical protein
MLLDFSPQLAFGSVASDDNGTPRIAEDYHTAKMPPVNVGLLNGELA